MEKAYSNIVYFFIGVTAIIFIGFFKTHFSLFSDLSQITLFHHFHATVLMMWLALLIIQPVLIRKGNYTLHSALGKFSYFLVPVVVISMLMAYRNQYFMFEKMGLSHNIALATVFDPLTDVLPFTIFYILAISNTKKIPKHMRYMIGTALLVVGSGIVRILFLIGLTRELSFYGNTLITTLLFVSFIWYDRSKGRPIIDNAFSTAFVIFLIPTVLSFIIPQTVWWQNLAEIFVNVAF